MISEQAVDASTPSKRRSHGGDSKYGFSSPIGAQSAQPPPPQQQRESSTPLSPRSGSYNGYPYNRPGQQPDYMNGAHPPSAR